MSASSMIVADECPKVPTHTGLVEHNQVIQAFATNGADHPLDVGPLPWRAWRRQYLFDAHRLDLLNEVMAEDAVPIAQQITRGTVPRERLPEFAERSILQWDVP